MKDTEEGNCQGGENAVAWTAEAARFRFRTLVVKAFLGAWEASGAFEWTALGYLALSSVMISLFGENLTHLAGLVGLQALVAAVILILCYGEARSAELVKQASSTFSSKFWHFWRHWYPHVFFLFCFEEMSRLIHLLNPGWEDAKLMAFDLWLTGVNPALWFEHLARPALTEFMEFSYFTYFVYLLILGGILYCKRDWKSYWAVMTYSAVGYVFGYVIAMLFPVQSPWFTLPGQWHSGQSGGPFTALINWIEEYGRVHGAAFPSQHVAGATAALWGAWRHRRWRVWIFLPFVACMCVSTVYVRNHYVADVLGGLVTGTLGYVLGRRVMKVPGSVANATETLPIIASH